MLMIPRGGLVNIRPYRNADQESVVALWREVFPGVPQHNVPEADIQRKLGVQRELFLVAVVEDTLVGTALMRAVEVGLARIGCPKLNLQIRADNREVVAFYCKLGFDVEERISMGKRLVG